MYFSRSIRTLEDIRAEETPSISRLLYPSYNLVASITHPDLQGLVSLMLHADPSERIGIEEVFARL